MSSGSKSDVSKKEATRENLMAVTLEEEVGKRKKKKRGGGKSKKESSVSSLVCSL